MKNLNFKMRLLLICGIFVAMISSCSENILTTEDNLELLTSSPVEGPQFENSQSDEDNIISLGNHDVGYPCDASLIDNAEANIVWSDECIPILVLTLCCDCPNYHNDFTKKNVCTTPPNASFTVKYWPFQKPLQTYIVNIPYTSIADGSCFDISTEITGYDPPSWDSGLFLSIFYDNELALLFASSAGCNL